MVARVRVPQQRRSRTRDGNGTQAASAVLKAWGATVLMKLLLRKSVLTAIGLGTVAAWWVKRRWFSPRPSLWSRLFY